MTNSKTSYYLSTLAPKFKKKIEWIKGDVSNASEEEKKRVKSEIRGYLFALEDACIITHTQYRCLYVYFTYDL